MFPAAVTDVAIEKIDFSAPVALNRLPAGRLDTAIFETNFAEKPPLLLLILW
ncbi:hypothetical protein D1AOALGA4SA_3646 [Olavius algarvensis Delta 1 endosymbiont]|nr:hypothetical protein D1AOALGA4SA_3646 [Olavius algarvensis Delta 1 endosymbiont]